MTLPDPATVLAAALAAPFAGALLIAAAGRWPNLRETVTLVTAGALFALVLTLLPAALAGGRPAVTLATMMPGLSLKLALEPLGMLFALLASALWIVNSVYSIGYMRGNAERHQTRFYVCFAIALGSTMGIAFAGNLLTLFVFYEALTLSTYPLVTHHGTQEAMRSGRTYLGLLLGTSIGFLLFAMLWTWQAAGTLEFTEGGILAGKVDAPWVPLLLVLYMYGIGKAALMPVHRWLPAAMVAPTPVSALLHAVAVVKAGVFTVIKVIVYIFGLDLLNAVSASEWLVYVAGTTIVLASLVALRQDSLKRLLAYSTVSQLSYVVMAAALATPAAIVAAAFHLVAHGAGKITLFFAAGSVYTAAHKTRISELNGIGRRMPWTFGAFAVGALSMIGLPPAAGFISKWYLMEGAIAAGRNFVLGVLVLSTLLNAAYFLPILYRAFFVAPDRAGKGKTHGEAPWPIVVATVTAALLTLLLFFFPEVPLTLARQLAGVNP
ncbi:MAG TPA: proton-conducting transporter membrane subunit [Acidiferrobacterales bacterium]